MKAGSSVKNASLAFSKNLDIVSIALRFQDVLKTVTTMGSVRHVCMVTTYRVVEVVKAVRNFKVASLISVSMTAAKTV